MVTIFLYVVGICRGDIFDMSWGPFFICRGGTVGLGHDFQKSEDGLFDQYAIKCETAFDDLHHNTCETRGK